MSAKCQTSLDACIKAWLPMPSRCDSRQGGVPLEQCSPLASLRDARRLISCSRGCRCAQPPANFLQPFGLWHRAKKNTRKGLFLFWVSRHFPSNLSRPPQIAGLPAKSVFPFSILYPLSSSIYALCSRPQPRRVVRD